MQEKLAYIYLNQTWAVSFIFNFTAGPGVPQPLRSFKELKVFILNKNIVAAPQTIGPIVTKKAIVYWILAHKTDVLGLPTALGPILFLV